MINISILGTYMCTVSEELHGLNVFTLTIPVEGRVLLLSSVSDGKLRCR